MHFEYLVLLALGLHFSFGYEGHRRGMNEVDEVFIYVDYDQRMTPNSISYRRMLVKYDTLVDDGAVVFSKAGVDTYSAIMFVSKPDPKGGIFVGARNWLIKFDKSFNETDAVEIPPSPTNRENCTMGGLVPAEECHNFIKYILDADFLATEQIYVCGTFAYHPSCVGKVAPKLYLEGNVRHNLSPSNPRIGVAAYLAGTRLYLGLATDIKGENPFIMGTQLDTPPFVIHTMKNEGWLNKAEFVGAFSPSEKDKFVYFVFREIAIEAPSGNVTLSRVARICKDDKGGANGHEREFGSFIKASLDCGEFNRVQAISYMENDPYFWATFTSDRRIGTAICGFRATDMDNTFRGPYLHRADDSRKWEICSPPYLFHGQPIIDTCFGLRSEDAMVNYTMMSRKIGHNCSEPFVTEAVLNKIAVSFGQQDKYTVFAGDDSGRVWKIDFSSCDVVGDVQLWEVVSPNETSKINGLALYNDSIIVLTNNTVMKILAGREYPGNIIEDPTTPAVTQPTSSSNTPYRSTSTKPIITTTIMLSTIHPNYAHSPLSSFQTALLLISTAMIRF